MRLTFANEENCKLISVINSGCTLNDNEITHIFDSFYRGSNVGSNSGNGLGLYICRQLIRKMKGEIFAETKNGEMTVTAVFNLI
ncbi:MAG: ATP-binding protein [Clostridia bacterium]|nr:ATP-binding protein [Clostridia bacterium]